MNLSDEVRQVTAAQQQIDSLGASLADAARLAGDPTLLDGPIAAQDQLESVKDSIMAVRRIESDVAGHVSDKIRAALSMQSTIDDAFTSLRSLGLHEFRIPVVSVNQAILQTPESRTAIAAEIMVDRLERLEGIDSRLARLEAVIDEHRLEQPDTAKKDRRFQILLVLGSVLLGSVLTLLIQVVG